MDPLGLFFPHQDVAFGTHMLSVGCCNQCYNHNYDGALGSARETVKKYDLERERNAIRHCVRSCELTRKCGKGCTLRKLRERETPLHWLLKPQDTRADLHNNEVGADVGGQSRSCSAGCDQAFQNGRLNTSSVDGEFNNRG
jgi:hypothetical protein